MQYSIIAADPPWMYDDKCSAGERGAAYHYPLMRDGDILNLPVWRLAEPDATLFLWVTFPRLPLGIEVMRAWGFQYKTVGFVWVKMSKEGTPLWGMGNWTRANAEIVLIGTRGNPKRVDGGVHQVVFAERGAHSEKPAEVYHKIETLMGDFSRVELFARKPRLGWDVFGNEVDGKDIREALKSIPVPNEQFVLGI